MKTTYILLVISLFVGTLVACNNVAPQPEQSPVGVSPLNKPEPAMSPLPVSKATPFQLERPLVAGASIVRGTGLAGIPVYIADVTFMGELLGTGTIGSNGKFEVTVPPLSEGHRIGVALGVLDGTHWKVEDFYKPDYYGPDFMQSPQVGFFFDTAMVGK
ncbi:MAG: hypothetical protein HY870_24385 [Chloroflexi bacterium]|nr:hypothetical protein [Chloroflexota bacterium]